MPVLVSMSFAILLWSLYPLAATVGLKSMSTSQMIVLVYFFAGIGAPLLALLYLWHKGLIKKAWGIQKKLSVNAYLIILVSGIAGVLCHGFFIIALTLANKGGVSLLFESWPVMAIIATPFLMKKTWKEVSLKEFIISLIALAGVAIIILSDEAIDIDLSQEMEFKALIGYMLAFVGAYMCAIVVVTKGTYSEYFNALKDNFGSTLISEMTSRLICFVIIIIGVVIIQPDITSGDVKLLPTIFIGVGVFTIGSALYTLSLLKSSSPTIHTLNYLVPVIAVIWLWLAGATQVNTGLFIGGFIVLFCNAYLIYASRKANFAKNTQKEIS
jgi:drug/metabolite transporter (DMT)-like permease